MLFAALGMGVVVLFLANAMASFLPGHELLGLFVIVLGGMLAYGVLGSLLSAFSPAEVRQLLRRKGASS